MDANGTKFHSLLGRDNWTDLLNEANGNIVWEEMESSIRLGSRLTHTGKDRRHPLLSPDDRRGTSSDRFGNIYWIGEDKTDIFFLSYQGGEKRVYWSLAQWNINKCKGRSEDFQAAPHPVSVKPDHLSGLVVTCHDYLIAGMIDPGGILIFDLHAGNPPIVLLWPTDILFDPLDMTAAPDGGFWILDHQHDSARLWRINANGTVRRLSAFPIEIDDHAQDVFHPQSASKKYRRPSCPRTDIRIEDALPLNIFSPVTIEGLPDDTLLILASDVNDQAAILYHYRNDRYLDCYPLKDFFKSASDEPFKPIAHDMVFKSAINTCTDTFEGDVFLSVADRKQVYHFTLKRTIDGLKLKLQDCYYPMRTTPGKSLVVANNVVFYDTVETWVPLISQRPNYYSHGEVVTGIFDGKQHDCVWHRIFLDAIIPDGAYVTIQCLAANDEKLLPQQNTLDSYSWKEQPKPYKRSIGSDLPYHEPYPDGNMRQTGAGTWETLLHNISGRYLVIRLILTGTGRNSPTIRSLRVYYPRFSYLDQYLPALYREDKSSAEFLDRFLANIEGLFTTIEDRIAASQMLLDVDSIPAQFLDWLSGWFDIIQQMSWGPGRRRLWLKYAMTLFSQRGTVPGIIRAVRLATDPCPDESIFSEDVTNYHYEDPDSAHTVFKGFHVRIVEKFLLRRPPGVKFSGLEKAEGPGIYTENDPWEPAHGADRLHKQYQNFLREKYHNDIVQLNTQWETQHTTFVEIKLPPFKPENQSGAEDWHFFLQNKLSFTYTPVSCNKADTIAFRNFLARRYRTIKRLNVAWMLSDADHYESFNSVMLPGSMPSDGFPLQDWIQFVSHGLTASRYAHQFTVLIPTALDQQNQWNGPDPEVVKKIVDLEKPAHTQFNVENYFAMFRVGEARLGLETILEQGRPLRDTVLGNDYLAESYLSWPPAWKAPGRTMFGCDGTPQE